jgi:ABC-2 type transport system permease protein
MYRAARGEAGGPAPPGVLPYLYVRGACFLVAAGVQVGMTQAVVSDRDSYDMLKFVRLSPVSLRAYLAGRGLARAAQAVAGAVVTMAAGALLPELRQALGAQGVAWGWLVFYLAAGLAMLPALGLALSAVALQTARYGAFLGEGVAGLLYLLCGAACPVGVLPAWLRPLSYALPPTYWLEGMRRSLLGPPGPDAALGTWGQPQLALALVAGSATLAALAHLVFGWGERRAWRLGRYDEVLG